MTTPSTVQVLFAHPWTDPAGGVSYVVGQTATFDLDLAKRLVYNGVAQYVTGGQPALIPPGLVDDVELGQVLADFEKKVPRAGASPGFVVQLDADGQTLELGPPSAVAGAPSAVSGATAATQGVVKLAGDLAGSADAPTVPGLAQRLTLEQVQDAVAAMIVAGSNVTLAYNDDAGTLTIGSTATGGVGGSTDPELVRDTIAAALVAGSGMTVTVSDDANTITLAAAPTDPEVVRDAIGTALRAGQGVNVTVDDAANTITIGLANSTPGGLSAEDVQDIVAAFIVPGTGLTTAYDDATGALVLTVSGGAAGTTDPEVVRDVIGQTLMGSAKVQVEVDDANNRINVSTTATVNQSDSFLLDRGNHTGIPTLPNWAANTPYPANALVFRAGVMQVAKTALVPTGSFDQASWFAQSTGGATVDRPGTVTGLLAGARTASTIPLDWTAVPDATNYIVEYKAAAATVWTQSGLPTGPAWTITGLAASANYDVRVAAANSAGPGPASAVLATSTTATADTAPDVTPTNLRWAPAAPQVGQPVTFTVDVTNLGGPIPTGVIVGVLFQVNGTGVAWSDNFAGGLATGETATLTASGGPAGSTWTAGASGNYTITAVVDDLRRFAESNENNNSISVTLSVVAPTAAAAFTATWSGADNTAWPSPWVTVPAGASGVFVQGGKGVIQPPVGPWQRRTVRHNAFNASDVEIRGKVAISPRPGKFYSYFQARETDTQAYQLMIFSDESVGGQIGATLRKKTAAADLVITPAAESLVVSNSSGYTGDINFVLSVVGDTIKAKVWLATAAEPLVFNVTAPMDTQPLGPGSVGFQLLTGDDGTTVTAKMSQFVVTGTDLRVSSLSASPSFPQAGAPVTFSAVVTNAGATIAPGTIIGVGFRVAGALVNWSDNYTAGLTSGESVVLTANSGPAGLPTWTPTTAGTYAVVAAVDDVNRFPGETDESNNTTSMSLVVTASTSDAASSSTLLAKTFVESSGICMHFGRSGVWDGHAQIKSMLSDLGIKLIRGSWDPGNLVKRAFAQELRRDLGIRFIYWVGDVSNTMQPARPLTATRDEIKATNAGQPDTIIALEGWNEPDGWGDGYDGTVVRQFVIDTWNTMKADPATAGIQIYGPSMANVGNNTPYAAMGNIDAYVDKSNMHPYPGDKFRFNDALADDLYTFAGSNLDAPVQPGEIMISEFGISNGTTATSPPQPVLPEQYRAEHLPSMWVNTWKRSIYPNTIFSLFAEDGDAWYNGLGLANANYTPQTSLSYLGNLVSVLADPGADFTPEQFPYTITGGDAKTRSFPLWKRDGSLWLVIWQEDIVYNPLTNAVTNPPTPTVTISGFPSTRPSIQHYTMDSRIAKNPAVNATAYNVTSRVLPTVVRVAAPVVAAVRTTSASPVRRARDVTDIYGVAGHLTYPAYSNYAEVTKAMDYLGCKNFRDGWGTGRQAIADYVIGSFRPRGIKLCLVHDARDWPAGTTGAQMVAQHKSYGYLPDMRYAEMSNERDLGASPDAQLDQARIDALNITAAFKAESAASHIVRCGPSLADTNADAKYQRIGVLPDAQACTFHDYPGVDRMMSGPVNGTDSGYAITNTMGRNGRYVVPTPSGTPVKVISTECGFSSGTFGDGGKNMPDAARPAQELRVWLEHARGIGSGDRAVDVMLSCNYELVDQGTNGETENAFGLFRADWTPKPAATAIRNLMQMLTDSASNAATFVPTSLGHTLTGGDNDTRSLLMQKADGSWWLAVWQEWVTWNGATTLDPAPKTLTLTLPSAQTVTTYEPVNGTAGTSRGSGASFTLAVGAKPLLVQISGGAASPPPAGSTFSQVRQGTAVTTLNATTGSVSLPAMPTAGNLLVLGVAGDKDTGALTAAGWTPVYSMTSASVSLYALWKVSNGTEQTTNVSWSLNSSDGSALWVAEYTGGSGTWQIVGQASSITDEATVLAKAVGPTGATTQAGLALAIFGSESAGNASGGAGPSFTNDFTLRSFNADPAPDPTRGVLVVAERTSVAVGTALSTTATFTGVADQWSAALLVFGRG